MSWNLSVRRGDQVKVVAGRDKGKAGRVLSVNLQKKTCTVEHVNMLKRHTRPNPSKQIKGGIVEREGAISVSNVMVICPSCGKPTRPRRHGLADGTKVRSCHRCDTTLEQ
jgi:large subunit ribosomal protein L24